ncbi:hypothetical protein LTR36_009261 [Oleoguttula mirabilis]|uniref:General negative regulator of transcription subunit n=1 Tax=Oleoguttula mirabilis TaxID=1507867 RepID=A0AAV9J5Y4_9PEZI|nr:hypothetical protein LTR36_009261 [Oleoguttula mirabilis]
MLSSFVVYCTDNKQSVSGGHEFKRVAEGIQAFDGIYEKLIASTNASQKEKLEDSLKKEIKKLQRSRDKIKGWASQNDIKDKKPLLDQRKLIESRMEMFKAVEKEMKTKAFSKEGLSAAAKLDPKEQEKLDLGQFLSDMVDELARQVESQEAEAETLQVGLKKKRGDTGKADRLSELERTVERHKWHSGKLEILLRSLENGSVDMEQVKDIEEGIKYYVEQNQEVDFMEDDTLYDDLSLEDEEGLYGMSNDMDKVSSQDAQSTQDEPPDTETTRAGSVVEKAKSKSVSEAPEKSRRSSTQQMKSPLPALSTLHTSLPGNVSTGKTASDMKPAPLPTIPTGQPLKYASAAAAAAASDKNGVGLAPLPPPPGAAKPVETTSPAPVPSQPVETIQLAQAVKAAEQPPKQPTPAPKEEPKAPEPAEPATAHSSKAPSVKPSPQVTQAQPSQQAGSSSSKAPQPPSPDSGIAGIALSNGDLAQGEDEEEEESIYHLPSSLTDLLDSFEETKKRAATDAPLDMPMLTASRMTAPTPLDAEKPNHYKPQNPYAYTPAHYPQEPLGIFDDPRLYSRIDTDSLFYAFYYRQGTYQQYLAAKALKSQSWRFHKQYQTWFQRHEEPKNITEEFEQGTYRFFDYESTWMNRRKADFKFAYKFLEDDL